jgi:hypothetical protein
MIHFRRGLAALGVFCLLQMLGIEPGFAQAVRTQTFSLHKGWNAVFLQVNPASPKPADCLQGTPVSMAAAFTGADKSLQFSKNLSVGNLIPQNGWDVWYAGNRPDAFLTSFFQFSGGKSYLLHADSDCTWTVTGTIVPATVNWQPNAFTLAGFCLDDLSPPTFDQFFAGSAAHHPYQIYHLVNDAWVKVDNAAATQMHSGEAYWIYCKGSSVYQGPLTVSAPNAGAFSLNGSTASGILLQNNSPNPLNVQVQNLTGSAALPLVYQLRAVTDTNVVTTTLDLPDVYASPSFDAGEKRGLWLMVRPERMTSALQTGLLKITTDLGTQFWLPVTANRSETQLLN